MLVRFLTGPRQGETAEVPDAEAQKDLKAGRVARVEDPNPAPAPETDALGYARNRSTDAPSYSPAHTPDAVSAPATAQDAPTVTSEEVASRTDRTQPDVHKRRTR